MARADVLSLVHDTAAFLAVCAFVAGMLFAAIAMTPCGYEDSMNCRWDASTQGNGHGRSFVDVAGWTIGR